MLGARKEVKTLLSRPLRQAEFWSKLKFFCDFKGNKDTLKFAERKG